MSATDRRQIILLIEAQRHPSGSMRALYAKLADRCEAVRETVDPNGVGKGGMVTAGLLMDEALRILDKTRATVPAVLLAQAIESLKVVTRTLD